MFLELFRRKYYNGLNELTNSLKQIYDMKTIAFGLLIAYVGVVTGQDDSLAGSFLSGKLC